MGEAATASLDALAGIGGTASGATPPRGRELFSQKTREYLESVFNVNPHPEEYIKYRLHNMTGLEMRQINDWFHNRRQRDRKAKKRKAEGDGGSPSKGARTGGSPGSGSPNSSVSPTAGGSGPIAGPAADMAALLGAAGAAGAEGGQVGGGGGGLAGNTQQQQQQMQRLLSLQLPPLAALPAMSAPGTGAPMTSQPQMASQQMQSQQMQAQQMQSQQVQLQQMQPQVQSQQMMQSQQMPMQQLPSPRSLANYGGLQGPPFGQPQGPPQQQSHSPLPRGQPLVGVLQPFLAAASAAGGSGGSPQPTLGSGGGGQDLARPTAQFPSFTGGPRFTMPTMPSAADASAAATAAVNIATRGAGLAGGGGNGGGGGGASGDPALWAPKAAAAAAAAGSHQDGPDGQARFRIEDIPMISELVGLDAVAALPSVRTATGETAAQLYLFEQVTRLDCLVMDSATAPKRNRTRHQHFWRNSDKIPKGDRVYVPSKEAAAAGEDPRTPVSARADLPASERSNAWTVAVTPRGVVDYLNRKTSPMGVRMIRALVKRWTHAAAFAGAIAAASAPPPVSSMAGQEVPPAVRGMAALPAHMVGDRPPAPLLPPSFGSALGSGGAGNSGGGGMQSPGVQGQMQAKQGQQQPRGVGAAGGAGSTVQGGGYDPTGAAHAVGAPSSQGGPHSAVSNLIALAASAAPQAWALQGGITASPGASRPPTPSAMPIDRIGGFLNNPLAAQPQGGDARSPRSLVAAVHANITLPAAGASGQSPFDLRSPVVATSGGPSEMQEMSNATGMSSQGGGAGEGTTAATLTRNSSSNLGRHSGSGEMLSRDAVIEKAKQVLLQPPRMPAPVKLTDQQPAASSAAGILASTCATPGLQLPATMVAPLRGTLSAPAHSAAAAVAARELAASGAIATLSGSGLASTTQQSPHATGDQARAAPAASEELPVTAALTIAAAAALPRPPGSSPAEVDVSPVEAYRRMMSQKGFNFPTLAKMRFAGPKQSVLDAPEGQGPQEAGDSQDGGSAAQRQGPQQPSGTPMPGPTPTNAEGAIGAAQRMISMGSTPHTSSVAPSDKDLWMADRSLDERVSEAEKMAGMTRPLRHGRSSGSGSMGSMGGAEAADVIARAASAVEAYERQQREKQQQGQQLQDKPSQQSHQQPKSASVPKAPAQWVSLIEATVKHPAETLDDCLSPGGWGSKAPLFSKRCLEEAQNGQIDLVGLLLSLPDLHTSVPNITREHQWTEFICGLAEKQGNPAKSNTGGPRPFGAFIRPPGGGAPGVARPGSDGPPSEKVFDKAATALVPNSGGKSVSNEVIPAPPAIEMAKRLSLPTRRPSSLNGTNSAPGQTLPISSSAPAAVPASSSQPSGPGGSGGDGGGGSGGGSDSSGGDGGGGGSKGVNELDFQNILDRAASMLAAETRSRAGASAVSAGALPTGTSSESPDQDGLEGLTGSRRKQRSVERASPGS